MSFIIPLGAANKKIGSVSSGLVSAELNAAKTEFTYTYTDGSVLKVPVTQPPLDIDLVEEKVDEYLDEHKDEIKGEPGEDGKSVQVLSTTETEADIATETVLAFSLAETTSDNESYTKTQSDVKYAKSVEVGNTSTIVVPDVNTLVKAINKVWLAGLDHMALDSTTKTLNLITRAGVVVPFDISQIILNTNIEEFKNVLVTNILDGQSLVYSASKQKWVNKSIDSSGMLVEAKTYTDDEIKKINNKGSIACDEKPTYYGGVITYKKGGVTKTTDNAGTWFYYLDGDGNATQTIFIEGTEFTIAMAGEINLDDYVAKTSVINAYDETFTDKTKVPNTQYMCDLKEAIDEELGEKVNTSDVTDTMGSAESPVSEDKIPNIKALKELHNAINTTVFKKTDVIASTDTTTVSSDANVHSAKRVDSLLGEKLDADDYVLTDLIDDTSSATDKVYSSSKVESVVSGLIDDTTASTTSVYSSSKVDGKFIASTNGADWKTNKGQHFYHFESKTSADDYDLPYNYVDVYTNILTDARGSALAIRWAFPDGRDTTPKAWVRGCHGDWGTWKELATTNDTEFGTKSITEITQAIPSRQMGFMVSYGNNITGRPTGSSAWGVVRAYRYGATIVMYYEETGDNCETYKALYNSDGTVKKAWTKIY